MPILGYELLEFENLIIREKPGEEVSKQLWAFLCMRTFPKVSRKIKKGRHPNKELLATLEAYQENENVDVYIDKASTYGIPITKHGRCPDF